MHGQETLSKQTLTNGPYSSLKVKHLDVTYTVYQEKYSCKGCERLKVMLY